mmetsp:Transcript_144763/g.360981  ORF Transcript_144763/g.360981 Transcript_144763/m.360981 type:complete len:232 (+) Transcript_144763:254-949(+)
MEPSISTHLRTPWYASSNHLPMQMSAAAPPWGSCHPRLRDLAQRQLALLAARYEATGGILQVIRDLLRTVAWMAILLLEHHIIEGCTEGVKPKRSLVLVRLGFAASHCRSLVRAQLPGNTVGLHDRPQTRGHAGAAKRLRDQPHLLREGAHLLADQPCLGGVQISCLLNFGHISPRKTAMCSLGCQLRPPRKETWCRGRCWRWAGRTSPLPHVALRCCRERRHRGNAGDAC